MRGETEIKRLRQAVHDIGRTLTDRTDLIIILATALRELQYVDGHCAACQNRCGRPHEVGCPIGTALIAAWAKGF